MDKIFAITYKFPHVFCNIYIACQTKNLDDFKSVYRDQDAFSRYNQSKDFF